MYTIIKHSFISSFLAALVLIAACKKDKDIFSGRDNYIVGFTIKQGTIILNGQIVDSVISIEAPDGFSLENATATVQLSENASIYPDPASISNWNEDIQFAVTAHDNRQFKYTYTVTRKRISSEGSVVLQTQADVDAFGETDFTAINGNLVIGSETGIDSITSLAPLAKLKEIKYALTIYPTFSGVDLTGFDKLEKVGSEIRIDGPRNLTSVAFPALLTAGDVYVRNRLIGTASFPELTKVSKTFTVDAPLVDFRVPNLKTVGGRITLNTLNGSNAMLAGVAFNSLEEADGIYITFFKNLVKVSLPELKKTGDLNFAQCTLLAAIITPNLEVSTGTITIPFTNYLGEISFPKLVEASTIVVDSKTIKLLDFPSLQIVKTRLAIANATVGSLSDFKALQRVDGELYLAELPLITSLQLPTTLQSLSRLTIYNRLTTPFSEININNLNIGELKVMANAIKTKLIGPALFNGTLTVASDGATYNAGYPPFPVLEGFNEIDSLSLDGYVSAMENVQIRSIKKINKGFRLENNNIKQFSMPDLEEVGGNFSFARLDQGIDEMLEFPKLKKIGGSFDLQVGSTITRTLRFTTLETVNGNFTLGTGYDADRSLENVLFPALKTIGGAMLLYGYEGNNSNQLLKNLDGFTTLTNVGSIEIINQKALESFAGLKEAYKVIEAEEWNTTGNKYNPTYTDLQNGNWVMP